MEHAKVKLIASEDDVEQYVNPDVLQHEMKELVEPDIDKVSAEDALDCQLA